MEEADYANAGRIDWLIHDYDHDMPVKPDKADARRDLKYEERAVTVLLPFQYTSSIAYLHFRIVFSERFTFHASKLWAV